MTGTAPTLHSERARSLWRKDRDHFIHPFTHFPSFVREGALVIAEGRGAYVYDADGKRYLDGIAGMWCVNIGHGNAELAEAMAEQAKRLAYFNTFVDTTNPPAAELAAKLAELAPAHLNRVFFDTGGSAANDTTVRTIHYYFNRLGKPKKKKLISRKDAYHGSSYVAMALTGKEEDHEGFDLPQGLVEYVSCPNPYRRAPGVSIDQFCDQLVAELEAKILELGPENVAAFFAEPILGSGGVIVPPPGYHRRTQEVCRRYEVLYVSDEVVTGFGRLGRMFASEPLFGLAPDVITCAKGLTSGYIPLGASIFSDAIYEVIRRPPTQLDSFSHGFTYSGHPVSCAVALKNIEIIERDRICEHVQEVGPYFEKRLARLDSLPLVGDVRGSHFMLCVENVANKQTRGLLPDEVEIGKRIANQCERRGLIVRPIGHLNVISPPLTLTCDEIDELVEILRASIEATADELVREGI
ncbi:MAG TPA: aminotransferase, partial [Myxococcota bacterium]|nr:aminotransferase [Myxococcota bacterium]